MRPCLAELAGCVSAGHSLNTRILTHGDSAFPVYLQTCAARRLRLTACIKTCHMCLCGHGIISMSTVHIPLCAGCTQQAHAVRLMRYYGTGHPACSRATAKDTPWLSCYLNNTPCLLHRESSPCKRYALFQVLSLASLLARLMSQKGIMLVSFAFGLRTAHNSFL